MIDFFNSYCSEEPRSDIEFGLCDDKDDEKAYSDINNQDNWIATVHNKLQIPIQFTPIDNCLNIRKPNSNDHESTCDGMLTFSNNLYLVELKTQRSEWITEAIGQLENTTKLLRHFNEEDLSNFKFKKAFASNKRHPRFTVLNAERKKRFFDVTGFRLDVQATITVS